MSNDREAIEAMRLVKLASLYPAGATITRAEAEQHLANRIMPLPYKKPSPSFMEFLRRAEAARKEAYEACGGYATVVTRAGGGGGGGTIDPKAVAEAHQKITAGLQAMVAQIEAERKAAPVLNAISATHNAFKADGRPHTFDPWRKG